MADAYALVGLPTHTTPPHHAIATQRVSKAQPSHIVSSRLNGWQAVLTLGGETLCENTVCYPCC